MKKHISILYRLSIFSLGVFLPVILFSQQLAFPGAEGFGRYSTGGKGGTEYHVRNLNDSGPGSFRDAVSAPKRIVVFDIAGVIKITSRVFVSHDITISGETAPGEGITIYGNGLSFTDANNSITRYIRVRMGINGDKGTDAITIAKGENMIFDHISVSWGRDETFSVSGPVNNITIQNCIIAEGLFSHSAGGLIQTTGGISLIRNLYINNHTRNPKVKGKNQFVNNVIYNWRVGAYILGDSQSDSYANVSGNYFIAGPNTSSPPFTRGNTNFHIYATKNLFDSNRNGSLDGAEIPREKYTVVDWQSTPYDYPPVAEVHPDEAYNLILKDAGASKKRDATDLRLITVLASLGKSGEIVSEEPENFGAFPPKKINRQELVQRHNPIITKADSLSSLSVGNGKFAFTVDVTGLQSFPKNYEKGVPLGTQSEWGWHSFIDTSNFKREEAIKTYHLNGRDIGYTVQWNSPERNKAAANWFRQNPHRLQLGNLGFEIIKKDGSVATLSDIENIHQELDLWTGEIRSHFTIESVPVDVSTFCDPESDAVAVKIKSPLINERRLKIRMRFPYPTGAWTDEGTNWKNDEKHVSVLITQGSDVAVIEHQLDTTKYYVHFHWNNKADIEWKQAHYFLIMPENKSENFEFTTTYSPSQIIPRANDYTQTKIFTEAAWKKFWSNGAAVDFSGSTDPRAFELERRIILSQYLIKIQETGSNPPQETGLTYNSWFGKPHMEMPYWHLAHYPYWGQKDLLDKNMDWYFRAADKGRAIAKRQGFEGIRWQKMTDNSGDETPSSVGAFLIWQQPHLIYFAESMYRDSKDPATLNKFKDLVFGTADFMASYPFYEKDKNRYILGKGVIPAQERFKAEETFNPTYELVYWKWGLSIAQQWRERLKMPRNKKWDEVLKKLSSLPVQDGMYLAAESAKDSYTNPEFRTDHPSVLAAFGVMPATGQVDQLIMKNTFNWIWDNWTWKDTWGWDYPMVAMTATRLGMPDKAVDALLMNVQKNTYLVNGHNYQDDRLRLYLPGNGGLLSAIALMCAGYDGCKEKNPGIPKIGWKVRWEGLKPLP